MDEIVARGRSESKSELHIGVSTLENLVKGGRIDVCNRSTIFIAQYPCHYGVERLLQHIIAKGRGAKTFTKWLDSYIDSIKDRKVAEIGISLCRDTLILHMKWLEKLEVLGAPISILETGSIIQTHTGEGAFAVMVRYE